MGIRISNSSQSRIRIRNTVSSYRFFTGVIGALELRKIFVFLLRNSFKKLLISVARLKDWSYPSLVVNLSQLLPLTCSGRPLLLPSQALAQFTLLHTFAAHQQAHR
jgi:hypothetical protein